MLPGAYPCNRVQLPGNTPNNAPVGTRFACTLLNNVCTCTLKHNVCARCTPPPPPPPLYDRLGYAANYLLLSDVTHVKAHLCGFQQGVLKHEYGNLKLPRFSMFKRSAASLRTSEWDD